MSAPAENINNRFFEGMYKDVWRMLMPEGLSRAECDFIVDVAQLQPGARVLDLMCGHGRHALELARRGMEVVAVDNLGDYVQEINKTADKENLPVAASTEDVQAYRPQATFHVVICMGNSFAFFDEEGSGKLLETMAASLGSGGKLVIGSWMIAEVALKHFKEKEWMQVGPYKYLLQYHFATNPARIESEHTVIREDGAMEIIEGVDYIFTIDQLRKMMGEKGLRLDQVYATPRKKPFTLGDAAAYLVASKI